VGHSALTLLSIPRTLPPQEAGPRRGPVRAHRGDRAPGALDLRLSSRR